MAKHNFIANLFATLSAYATGKTRHAHTKSNNHAGHGNLTASERQQIAEQIRVIATRAAAEYRQRREPVPPYVLSAINCGLKTDWRGSILKLKPHLLTRFRISREAILGSLSMFALLVLIPMGVLGLHRQPGQQTDYHQLQQQMQTLEQQNGDLSREIEALRVRVVSAEEKLDSQQSASTYTPRLFEDPIVTTALSGHEPRLSVVSNSRTVPAASSLLKGPLGRLPK